MELSVTNLQSVDGKDIKHIIVMTHSTSSPVFRSLFVALQPISTDPKNPLAAYEDKFVWGYAKKALWLFNLSKYSIASISVQIKAEVSARGYIDTPDSQKEAKEVLTILYTKMADAKRLTPMGLIDFRTYTVPDAWKKEIMDDDEATTKNYNRSGGASLPVAQSHNGYNPHACGYSPNTVTTVYKRKEVSTTTFERTSKYDVTEAMKNMEAKLAAVKAGTYEKPKLSKIPGDDIPLTNEIKVDKDIKENYLTEGCWG